MGNIFGKTKPRVQYKMIHQDYPTPDHLPILPVQVAECTTTEEPKPVPILTNQIHNISFNINRPEPFKNQEPKDWIIQFDVCSKANGWDDGKKLNNIPPLFQQTETARRWYSYTYKNEPPTDYKEFCKKLIDTLSPSNEKYVSFTRMYERNQQLAEPPVDYFFAKMDLIRKYDANNTMNKEMEIDFLVDGLLPEYKKEVFGKFKTTQEVFNELRKLQTIAILDEAAPVYYNYTPMEEEYQDKMQVNEEDLFQNNSQGYEDDQYMDNEMDNQGYSQGIQEMYPDLPDDDQQWDQAPPVYYTRLCHYCSSPEHLIRNCPERYVQ